MGEAPLPRSLPFCLALAGCAGASAPAPDSDATRRAVQATACGAAVAEHVGKRADAVQVTWTGAGADGIATFEARDDGRLHSCTIDAAGRVLRIDHVYE
jgi:hypothetical protein